MGDQDKLVAPDQVAVVTNTGGGYMSRQDAARAMREGTARAPKDLAEMGAIKAQEAQALKAEQYGGLGGAAKAFAVKAVDVTGLARPLAVGWERLANGDEAANRLNENLKGLEEENPYASMGGTAASFLAPGVIGKVGGALAKGEGLLAKGAGLVGRAGEAAALPMKGLSALGRGAEGLGARVLGEGALGTIGSKALGMGAETAVLGGANELSHQLTEEALGNPALNAERIFSAAGHDFVYGAVLGGALGVGSVVGKKAMGGVSSLLKGKGLSEAADEFAGNSIWQGSGATKAMSSQAADRIAGGTAAVGNHAAAEAESLIGRKLSSFEDLAEVATKGIEREGQKLGETLRKGSEALEKAGQKIEGAAVLERAEKQALEKYSGVGFGPERKRIADWFLEAKHKIGLLDELAQPVEGAESKAIKLEDIWGLRRDADARWTNMGNKAIPKDDAYHAIRSALEDNVLSKMDLASEVSGGTFGKEYRAVKDSFAKFRTLEKATESGEARAVTNQPLGLTDKIMGAAGMQVGSVLGGGLPGALVGGAVGGWGSKFVRGKFPYVAARAAQAVSKIAETAQVTKAAKLATDDAVRGLLDAPKAAAARAIPASLELFGKSPEQRAPRVEKAVAALRDTAAQAQRVSDRTTGLGNEAPKTATALATQAANVNAYLLSKAPKPELSSLSLVPWAQKPTYQDQEVAKFAQALRVAADPNHVIHMAARGLVNRDDVEALKSMYPQAYQDARTTFMDLMFDPKHQAKVSRLPLDKRLSIVTLFDIPTPLTEPGFVGAVQEGIAEQGTQPQPSDQAPQNGRTAGDAKAASAVSDAMRTDTERLSHGAEL